MSFVIKYNVYPRIASYTSYLFKKTFSLPKKIASFFFELRFKIFNCQFAYAFLYIIRAFSNVSAYFANYTID